MIKLNTMNDNNKMRKRFDFEYATSYKAEVEYLKNNGICYTFVKDIDGISTYKYKKTCRLFYLLSLFYKE